MLRGKACLDRAQPVFDVVVNALQDDDGVLEALPGREPNQLPIPERETVTVVFAEPSNVPHPPRALTSIVLGAVSMLV